MVAFGALPRQLPPVGTGRWVDGPVRKSPKLEVRVSDQLESATHLDQRLTGLEKLSGLVKSSLKSTT